jgi:uncharacterized membrane protein YkvI
MFWIIFGILISIVGIITSKIAANFNEFDTTPFSKYTFSKFCYEFEGTCNTLFVIGVVMILVSLFS